MCGRSPDARWCASDGRSFAGPFDFPASTNEELRGAEDVISSVLRRAKDNGCLKELTVYLDCGGDGGVEYDREASGHWLAWAAGSLTKLSLKIAPYVLERVRVPLARLQCAAPDAALIMPEAPDLERCQPPGRQHSYSLEWEPPGSQRSFVPGGVSNCKRKNLTIHFLILGNTLPNMTGAWAQNGHSEKSKEVFDEMPSRDRVSWETIDR
ncbi:hypothetical protein SELMODRAFT_426492 [Selaginella moellendorffii]|uniref:Uncharacterized protein n=1 Tax=Selaginella moellendorffii TaxID=88036 RepID=D8SWJ2_SELML|nr:hypothetical protein SELMODRAFT_426492 [Selaginella moellendorffii]